MTARTFVKFWFFALVAFAAFDVAATCSPMGDLSYSQAIRSVAPGVPWVRNVVYTGVVVLFYVHLWGLPWRSRQSK